jgi:hypothetical protein
MAKKSNVEKTDQAKGSDEAEETLDSPLGVDIAEIMESVAEQPSAAGNIDITKIIKSTGGVQAAVNTAVPMIDQIATQARLEAQRASALAMKEYRRQLQGIMLSMQGTIREEGTRLADQICAKIVTQIRQAVLLETEKKALNLVDEFVLGWQIEAESMSQDLLNSDIESEIESDRPNGVKDRSPVMTAPEAKVNDEPAVSDKTVKHIDTEEKDKTAMSPVMAAAEKTQAAGSASKKPETVIADRPKIEQSENEKKVVFDFATFIAQSKSPLKS